MGHDSSRRARALERSRARTEYFEYQAAIEKAEKSARKLGLKGDAFMLHLYEGVLGAGFSLVGEDQYEYDRLADAAKTRPQPVLTP